MENRKLSRTAGILDRVLKILQGFAIAGVIVSVIFIPLTLILGEKIIADASHLKLGAVTLKLAGDMSAWLDYPRIKASIVVSLICMAVAAAAVWYCLRVLRSVLRPMIEGSPFTAGISTKIRKLAWTVLIGGGLVEIGSSVSSVLETRAYQLDRLLNMDRISSVSFNWMIHLWFVAAALILFFLSWIFRYGEELQREADETL
ncbi:MAG: DUF2975 domain-containing protein [Oscillospiraceae bacterium]|nr:DUF2975 domain-containing protein [Oscillospiraceae bacterium]